MLFSKFDQRVISAEEEQPLSNEVSSQQNEVEVRGPIVNDSELFSITKDEEVYLSDDKLIPISK